MRRNVFLALAFVLVALVSAVVGAIFLAPVLAGTQIVGQTVPTPTTPTVASATVIAPIAPTMPPAPASPNPPTAAVPATIEPAPSSTIAPTPSASVIAATADPNAAPNVTMLDLLNAERAANGCAVALQFEPRLAQAAQAHAEDMARVGTIDHVGSDGATYSQRLDRVGYQYIRRGENIAAGFATPAEVVLQWLDEPPDGPHRTNILNCAYRETGIGLAFRADAYPYWVLDLAEPQ